MMRVHQPSQDTRLMNRASESEQYEFHVRGELSDLVLADFGDLKAAKRHGETILTGPVPDQAALFGILDLIESLGIHLIEVRLVRPDFERTTLNPQT
jgi:hypothetical protein